MKSKFILIFLVLSGLYFRLNATTEAYSADETTPRVLVGDSQGLSIMADSALTIRERNSGKVNLYLHQSGIIELFDQGRGRAVASVFEGVIKTPQIAEISVTRTENGRFSSDRAREYFHGADSPWNRLFINQGFRPVSCNINGLDVTGETQTLADWSYLRSLLTEAGLSQCGAFGDINGPDLKYSDFNLPYWNFYKDVALTLGGVAIDSPPGFAIARGDLYLNHIVQVIQWARRRKLRVSVVMAVYNDDTRYHNNVVIFTNYLVGRNALPTEWVVGGYRDGNNNKTAVAVLGDEKNISTLNATALWLVER